MSKVLVLSALVVLIAVLFSNAQYSESVSLWDLVVYAKPQKAVLESGDYPIITGKVVNQADKPASDIQVKIRFGSESAVAVTDSSGNFNHNFGQKDRTPGIYIVNIIATSEDGKIGLTSTKFEIRGVATPSFHEEERFELAYPDDLDYENNPIDALIYKHRQEIAEKLKEEHLKKQERKKYQEFLDEQRQIAAQRLNETLVLEDPGSVSYTEQWYFPNFLKSLDKNVRGIIGTQLNYTAKMWEEAKIAMDEVIVNGGTWEEAQEVFIKKASMTRETMESLTINKTNSTGLIGTNSTDIAESLHTFNVTSVEQVQEVLDVNGTAIKTGVNGTIIRLNVNGTVLEFLINGTSIIPLHIPQEDSTEIILDTQPKELVNEIVEPKSSTKTEYGSLEVNPDIILIKRDDIPLKISGTITDFRKVVPLHIIITSPDGDVEKLQIRISSKGAFETFWFVKSYSVKGNYLVDAIYDNQHIGTVQFSVDKIR